MALFFKRNDLIKITSEQNKYYKSIMICTESNQNQADFKNIKKRDSGTIFLSQSQYALDQVGEILGQIEDYPEYLL